jgi:hypothetical protein
MLSCFHLQSLDFTKLDHAIMSWIFFSIFGFVASAALACALSIASDKKIKGILSNQIRTIVFRHNDNELSWVSRAKSIITRFYVYICGIMLFATFLSFTAFGPSVLSENRENLETVTGMLAEILPMSGLAIAVDDLEDALANRQFHPDILRYVVLLMLTGVVIGWLSKIQISIYIRSNSFRNILSFFYASGLKISTVILIGFVFSFSAVLFSVDNKIQGEVYGRLVTQTETLGVSNISVEDKILIYGESFPLESARFFEILDDSGYSTVGLGSFDRGFCGENIGDALNSHFRIKRAIFFSDDVLNCENNQFVSNEFSFIVNVANYDHSFGSLFAFRQGVNFSDPLSFFQSTLYLFNFEFGLSLTPEISSMDIFEDNATLADRLIFGFLINSVSRKIDQPVLSDLEELIRAIENLGNVSRDDFVFLLSYMENLSQRTIQHIRSDLQRLIEEIVLKTSAWSATAFFLLCLLYIELSVIFFIMVARRKYKRRSGGHEILYLWEKYPFEMIVLNFFLVLLIIFAIPYLIIYAYSS